LKNVIRMALAGAALFGCATEKSGEVSRPSALRANAPDWVSRGSGAFSGEKGKIFSGVGYVADAANASSRRAAADARALADLGKVLDAKVAAVNSDRAPTAGGDGQALKNATRRELSSASVVDHWVDGDGAEFALAELDMETFEKNLEQMKELSAQTRDLLRANAARAFQEVSAGR
jgi:hypothetical protein